MAKNKTNFPEKEERDPLTLFIKKSTHWVQEYSKAVFASLFVGLLTFGSFLLFSYWQKQGNITAEESLYQARKNLMLVEKKAGGDILGFDSSQNFFGQSKKAKYDSSMDKLVNEYVILIKKWIKKPVGLVAAAEMSYFLYKYDKGKEAMELLKTASAYKKKNLTGFLIAFQMGTYLMDQNEYESAIKEFQFVTLNDKAKWLWPEALVRIALCYEKQNNIEEARTIYKQVKNDFSDSQAGTKATQYLNLLYLQDKIKAVSYSQKKGSPQKETEELLKTVKESKEALDKAKSEVNEMNKDVLEIKEKPK